MPTLTEFRRLMREKVAENAAKEARREARALEREAARDKLVLEREAARDLLAAKRDARDRTDRRALTKRIRALLSDPDFVQATSDDARRVWLGDRIDAIDGLVTESWLRDWAAYARRVRRA